MLRTVEGQDYVLEKLQDSLEKQADGELSKDERKRMAFIADVGAKSIGDGGDVEATYREISQEFSRE